MQRNRVSKYILQRCDHCGLTLCEVCGGDQHREPCNNCGEFYCSVCQENEDVNVALVCDYAPWKQNQCDSQAYCVDCVDDDGCLECLGLHYPKLATRNKKLADEFFELRNENEELQKKLDEDHEKLAEDNKRLREEIDELRKKLASDLGMAA